MPSNKKLLQAAAGSAGGDPLYVEDVFSTYLYTGTASAITINNGIDLSGEGGLTWLKSRNLAEADILMDTTRGVSSALVSNNTNAAFTLTDGITAFNSNGFTLGTSNITNTNASTNVSWSFRKAKKFFDIVTYTGNGGTPQNISHSLGSVPGMILVKRTDSAFKWFVYHTSTGATEYLQLNDTAGAVGYGGYWDSTAPTDSVFTIGTDTNGNASGGTYVAYLFASDAGGFGEDEDENIIKCGSYTTDGSGNATVNLGFEPQWILSKRTNATGAWYIRDVIRGMPVDGNNALLYPNSSGAEAASSFALRPSATGFTAFNDAASQTNIYMAIRRPMKTPEAGTEVFMPDTRASSGGTLAEFISGFPVDMYLRYLLSATYENRAHTRLLGETKLITNTTAAEVADTTVSFASNVGAGPSGESANTSVLAQMFKRAAGFMDVVARTGTGGSGVSVPHNLTVVPELVISKTRTASSFGTDLDKWFVWSSAVSGSGNDSVVQLQSNSYNLGMGFFYPNSPTASAMTVHGNINYSGDELVYYLFATLAGVSKVGSYTGTGADLNVDCGFTASARFILIKRTDSTGDWYTYDSARGISAGNDPYLLLNTTAAQVTNTDYIDPLNAGFTVTSSAPAGLNANGGSYIFLAIA